MSLEHMPFEIKIMLMSKMSSIDTLKNIVQASPDYHQAYLRAREEILHSITIRILYDSGVSTLDAWTTVNAPQIDLNVDHRREMIIQYLQRYGDCMTDGRPRFTVNESLDVLSLHHKIEVLIGGYCRDKLTKNQLSGEEHVFREASLSELHRLYRAFYRFEIYCRIFCGTKGHLEGRGRAYPPSEDFDEVDVAEIFLGLFPVHEVEELACVHKYIEEYYRRMIGLYDSDIWKWLDILVTAGPCFMYLSFTQRSAWDQLQYLEAHQKAYYSELIPDITWRDALDAYERILNTGVWPWKGIDHPASSERWPTVGWVWASQRGAANVDLKLRRWGYVFWDQKRLEEWGVTDEIMLSWPWRNTITRNNSWSRRVERKLVSRGRRRLRGISEDSSQG